MSPAMTIPRDLESHEHRDEPTIIRINVWFNNTNNEYIYIYIYYGSYITLLYIHVPGSCMTHSGATKNIGYEPTIIQTVMDRDGYKKRTLNL